MQPSESDRPIVRVVHIERDGASGESSARVAVYLGGHPASGGRIDSGDRRHFVRRRHVCLEVIRLLDQLCANNPAGKLRRVDIDVIIFRIFDKTAQVVESRVCGADGYFTVHRTSSSSICDNRVGPTEPRIDHDRSVHADLPIVDMKPGERLCRSHEVVEIEADGAAGHIACRITIYFHIRH